MDWHLALLLLAIAATWFAWRRAQRQAGLARARAAALAEPRWQYRLIEVSEGDGFGDGYAVTSVAGAELDPRELRWDDHGIEVIDVIAEPDSATLLDDAFEAGAAVELVPGTDETGAATVAVWDHARALHGGWVPAPVAAHVERVLESGELGDSIVLRQAARRGSDTRIQLLLVHHDTDVEA